MFAIILAAILQVPPQKSDAVIGVSAIHLESGKRLSIRNTERFPMGSVYKFPIALAVLRRVDAGTLSLQQEVTIQPRDFSPGHSPLRDDAHGRPITLTVRELLRHMVSLSDNTASDTLLRLVGGPRVVTTRMAELGARDVRIDRSEKQMAIDLSAPGGPERYARDARDTSTPDAMAGLLVTFWCGRDGLSKESHQLLVHWMTTSPTGPRRIRTGVPRATLAHKTGTMPGTGNDVGILTSADGKHHVVIAIFTKASKRDHTPTAEDDIAAIAAKVWESLHGRDTVEDARLLRPRLRGAFGCSPVAIGSHSVDLPRRKSRRPHGTSQVTPPKQSRTPAKQSDAWIDGDLDPAEAVDDFTETVTVSIDGDPRPHRNSRRLHRNSRVYESIETLDPTEAVNDCTETVGCMNRLRHPTPPKQLPTPVKQSGV